MILAFRRHVTHTPPFAHGNSELMRPNHHVARIRPSGIVNPLAGSGSPYSSSPSRPRAFEPRQG